MSNPCNPTGKLVSGDELAGWTAIARRLDCADDPSFSIAGDNEGVGYFRVNQRGGWRMNTAKAFLRGARKDFLKVETGAHVKRLIVEEGRAVGSALDQILGAGIESTLKAHQPARPPGAR